MRLYSFFYLLGFVFLISSCAAKRKSTTSNSSYSHDTGSKSASSKSDLKAYYSDVLGVNSTDLNLELYAYIDQWMDVPHRLGGMSKSGIDCSGFVTLVYQNVYGKNLPRRSSDMAEEVKRKYEDKLKEGDLVFFSFGKKDIDHVGIYLHNNKFVHVSTTKGVIISNLKDVWYYKYFERCGTPK